MFSFCPRCGVQYAAQERAHCYACSACHFVWYQNSKPTVSALIVDGNNILLGKRAIDPAKGKWDIIGGFLEYGEHPEAGLKREVKEESGLDVEVEYCLGYFMDVYGKDEESTLNIAFVVRVVGGDLKSDDDVAEVRWFGVDEIPYDLAFRNGQEMIDAWIARRGMSVS